MRTQLYLRYWFDKYKRGAPDDDDVGAGAVECRQHDGDGVCRLPLRPNIAIAHQARAPAGPSAACVLVAPADPAPRSRCGAHNSPAAETPSMPPSRPFALAVTHPAGGNIGGGGFMIVAHAGRRRHHLRLPREGASRRRERCISARRRNQPRPDRAGILAPGVPGTVRGLELVAPKVRQAAVEGRRRAGEISSRNAASCSDRAQPDDEPQGGWRKFRVVGGTGRAWRRRAAGGDRLVLGSRRDARCDRDGGDAFYKGWIADRIADDMKANGGIITKRVDLADRHTKAKERAPISSMPPPSSGGVALIEMLNILEP